MLIRIFLFFIGFLLLRSLWRMISGAGRRVDPAQKQEPLRRTTREEPTKFEGAEIVDAEFEEVDGKPGASS